jgi:hypothetical protein
MVLTLDFKPTAVYKSQEECLHQLATSLGSLAQLGVQTLASRNTSAAKKYLDAATWLQMRNAIVTCLLVADANPNGSYLLLGDLLPAGYNPTAPLMSNFRVTVTEQLLYMAGNIIGLVAALDTAPLNDSLVLVEPITVRAAVLGNTAAFTYRHVASQLLGRMMEKQPGSNEEHNELQQQYVSAVQQHFQSLSTVLTNHPLAEQLAKACIVNFPACAAAKLEANQSHINGIYLPPEMHQAFLQHLARLQAEAMTQSPRGQT